MNKKIFNFSFFRIDPKWRWMSDLAKNESAKEAMNSLSNSRIKFCMYSTLGLSNDTEFLLWSITDSVDSSQKLISKLYLTVFGKYIVPVYVYISTSITSIYSNSQFPCFVESDELKKYVSVYPFIKKRKWYSLSNKKKQKINEQYLLIIKKYPQIIINCSYTLVNHDEFILTFETNNICDLQQLILNLDESYIFDYISSHAPKLCVKSDLIYLINSLG